MLLIFLGGCTELTADESSVEVEDKSVRAVEDKSIREVEDKSVSEEINKIEESNEIEKVNKTENVSKTIFLDPEDMIELKDGRKLIYKGNVSVSSVDGVEWKATFFLNNDPKRRYNLAINNFLLIGGTQIIITEFVTYQQGSVGIEVKET